MLSTTLNGINFYKWRLDSGTELDFATFSNSEGFMRCSQISENLLAIVTNSSDIEDFCDESDWIMDCSEGNLIDNLLFVTSDDKAVIFREYALNCWSSVYQRIIGDRASVEDYWYENFVPEEEEE